ncbi:EAL domain-containing protein [Massilia sp. IC2-477]|uniref:bifunctional diguanylate cyclase/phosphodiesterase n=1 Tax=Massilia sp. IC2-477 TaxID=2887198 RepID=UPI001D129083|nr:EAL domain-containing protein [Massilia sp. IC2-477]MCC2955996.1 EAL domain-containing protein [Massilia sp. IC2-477]
MNPQADKAMPAGTATGLRAIDSLRPLLAFLRPRMTLLLVWPALALAAAVALWSYVLLDLGRELSDRRTELAQQVDAYTRSLVIRTERSIGDTDRLLLLLRHNWAVSARRVDLSGTLEAGIFSKQYISAVALVDREGSIMTSTHPGAIGRYVGDRAYFRAQQAAGADRLYVSRPLVGDLSGREVVAFSRPLLTPEGRFDGIVLVSVLPSFFTQHYAEPILGEHGFVAVVVADGALVASRSGATVHSMGAPFLLAPLPLGVPSGVAQPDGGLRFADGRARVVGWRPFSELGLVGVVGVDQYTALAPYRAHRQEQLAGAWWNTAWLALAALLASAVFVHAKWRRHQVETIRATYRLATEDAGEGFFINRPLRDLQGVVRDFLVVDCNQFGADMFGKQPRELIGHRLSEFYQGELFRAACARLCQALDTGLYDRELPVTPSAEQPLKPQWIRYKAVRAGDDLAVTIRDISEGKAHLTELERRSNSDELTGLPNRYWIQQYLPQAIGAARADGQGLAVLFIDLDGFKTVNDALGHAAGDELLRTVGKRLRIAVRPRDHVVRLGGDEFVVVLEQVASSTDVEHVAERILGAFRDGFHLHHALHVLNASIGISLFPQHGDDAQTLLKNADIAMYSVKTEGKGKYRFFHESFFEAIRTRLETEVELRHALDRQQFVLHYQPRVDLVSGAPASMEALVRWERPDRGLTGPDRFIPLLEETGLIVRLGEQVIDGVCRQLAQWKREGAAPVPVSVNVSPRQFSQSDILGLFRAAVARHGIDPRLLEIEVTESSMMQEGIGESAVFRQLRDMGIKLCIDDFGTGYSSLSQLQKLHFDVLKIDRAFVLRIEHPEGDTLIASMIAMAHALGMRVVAEGIESRRQMQLLQALGCDEGQGYFFSRPVPAEKIHARG